MSREKQNDELVQMYRDLGEIFDEEYEKRRLITPQNTAEKLTAKGYRKQIEGEWLRYGYDSMKCSLCGKVNTNYNHNNFCPNCGARMKGENK